MSLADPQWSPTSVQVTALQARGLRVKGKSGTNDAYALLQVGKEKFQTSVVEKSVTPVWKEEATFDLQPLQVRGGGGSERSTLLVQVLHRALVGPDKLLGQAVINLPQLSEDTTRNKTEWFRLLDKQGKPDKDRGEVLLDIQFMRNNMTASMFDLSSAGKSRSRLGKFKDKVRGKKKESDSSSGVVPALTQVMTDSEEEADGDGEEAGKKDGKPKKLKVKSLFSSKSNLQKTMSQSMSVLPGKNSSLSGSQSSGLNVDPSEGKKKFKFKLHKRSGSSDSKDLSFGNQKRPSVEQSNMCINGSHVYCEEPQPRTSRAGSNFSLASSGHGSMEDVPDNSSPSLDSLRAVRQYSPWMEEEEEQQEEEEKQEIKNQPSREDEAKMEEEEERRKKKEEEDILKRQEELKKIIQRKEEEKLAEELQKLAEEKRRVEEEEKKRLEEEEKRREEEKIEEERRAQEEEERRQEEEFKLAEKMRIEEENRLEELRRQKEEEERRLEEELMLAEKMRIEAQRRQKEEEERLEEMRRKEEEDMIRKQKELEEMKRAEEEEMRRKEEILRRQEEEKQKEYERKKKEEEDRARKQKEIEERKRKEEEEMRRRQEQLERELEEERLRLEEEEEARRAEQERLMREEEERIRVEEEIQRKEEEKRQREEERRLKEVERLRQEEEEERMRREEQERLEEKRRRENAEKARKENEKLAQLRRLEEEEKLRKREKERKLQEDRKAAELISKNPFDEDFSENPFEENYNFSSESQNQKLKEETVKQRCDPAQVSEGSRPVSCEETDPIRTQREKRPAPRPPGSAQNEKQAQDVAERALVNKLNPESDVRTVDVVSARLMKKNPLQNKPPADSKNTQSSTQTSDVTTAKHGKRPAPSRPQPAAKDSSELKIISSAGKILQMGATENEQVLPIHGSNPFEEELSDQEDSSVSAPVCWPPALTADGVKLKSSKMARAPAPPAKDDASSGDDAINKGLADTNDHQRDGTGHMCVNNGPNKDSQHIKTPEKPPNSRRLLPVKPLNPSDHPSTSSFQEDTKSSGFGYELQAKNKVDDTVMTGPYSQLTREELICLVLKQESQLLDKQGKISELEQYIDNLLVRVIEEQPSILMSLSAAPKKVA